MTSGRRSPPPDLKGTLGTLLRSTLEQVGAMTDVARRQASRQKTRLDGALLERRRQAALAELGERVYQLYSSGQLELEDLPELAPAFDEVEAIERRLAEGATDDTPRSPRDAWSHMQRSGASRADERSGHAAGADRAERVWRPPHDAARPGGSAGDDDAEHDGEASAHRRRTERSTEVDSPRRRRAAPPVASGGIAFVADDAPPATVDPDEDLAEYMNPDDVAPRGARPPK